MWKKAVWLQWHQSQYELGRLQLMVLVKVLKGRELRMFTRYYRWWHTNITLKFAQDLNITIPDDVLKQSDIFNPKLINKEGHDYFHLFIRASIRNLGPSLHDFPYLGFSWFDSRRFLPSWWGSSSLIWTLVWEPNFSSLGYSFNSWCWTCDWTLYTKGEIPTIL